MADNLMLPPELVCSSILLRLAVLPDHISSKTGKLKPRAFYLQKERPPRPPEKTLSLIIRDACTLHEAFTTVHPNAVGMATLHRGRILDLNLREDVRAENITLEVEGEIKPDDPRRIYACIKNIPHKEDNLIGAKLIADLLSEQSRLVPMNLLMTLEHQNEP